MTLSPERLTSVYRQMKVIREFPEVISIVDTVTLEPARDATAGKTMLAIAAWVDEVRLIDNILL